MHTLHSLYQNLWVIMRQTILLCAMRCALLCVASCVWQQASSCSLLLYCFHRCTYQPTPSSPPLPSPPLTLRCFSFSSSSLSLSALSRPQYYTEQVQVLFLHRVLRHNRFQQILLFPFKMCN